MKINITRDLILPSLQSINNVVERRQTLPILGNVMLVAEDNELTLTATDMEVELVTKIPVNTFELIKEDMLGGYIVDLLEDDDFSSLLLLFMASVQQQLRPLFCSVSDSFC